jgi:hypothetical protein
LEEEVIEDHFAYNILKKHTVVVAIIVITHLKMSAKWILLSKENRLVRYAVTGVTVDLNVIEVNVIKIKNTLIIQLIINA